MGPGAYSRYRLPKDALDSPLVYTRSRDIHSVGIVLLQMLSGLDVMERYPDVYEALRNCLYPTAPKTICDVLIMRHYSLDIFVDAATHPQYDRTHKERGICEFLAC